MSGSPSSSARRSRSPISLSSFPGFKSTVPLPCCKNGTDDVLPPENGVIPPVLSSSSRCPADAPYPDCVSPINIRSHGICISRSCSRCFSSLRAFLRCFHLPNSPKDSFTVSVWICLARTIPGFHSISARSAWISRPVCRCSGFFLFSAIPVFLRSASP